MTHKSTGPGMIQLHGRNDVAIYARLFNFDFDDMDYSYDQKQVAPGVLDLKDEHKAFLLDNVGPVASKMTFWLTGQSSITGNADYNLRLSRQRADRVEEFLEELGSVAINKRFVGENLAWDDDSTLASELQRCVELIGIVVVE